MRLGLLGKNISYSFSKGYFTEKFQNMGLVNHTYENFDLETIEAFKEVIKTNPDINGLNVTIPYKQAVIPYLDKLEAKAKKIGAVNTIKFTKKGLKGYNTDIYGFKNSILPFLKKHHQKALILGTGWASKAIAFVFDELNIPYKFVSRNPEEKQFSYSDITQEVLNTYTILVNCTPLGTHPNTTDKPSIPYQFINKEHLLFDLIYNPAKTAFLKEGESKGAAIANGLKMLELQAEKAWEIWNS